MLTSLVIQLQAPAEASLPASLGRAGQALFLRLIAAREPQLAADLHAGQRLRPYTVSNLMLGSRKGGSLRVRAGERGWLRFTGLTAQVSRHLLALAADPPPAVEIDNVPFTVTGAVVAPAEHPWAGGVSYQDLAAAYLLQATNLPGRITLDFVSPTTFRSQGVYRPFPLPEAVFGSLFKSWQTFAPIALDPELFQSAGEMVVVSHYKLRTRGIPYKQKGPRRRGSAGPGEGAVQIGFTGQVTFAFKRPNRYRASNLHLLAAFAFYSGVGYQTGAGLGQVRPASRSRIKGHKE